MTPVWLAHSEASPTPAEISSYLLQQGWVSRGLLHNWARYEKQIHGSTLELEVPQLFSAPDYPRVISFLLEDLARIEDRAPSVVLRDVRSSSVDIVRIAMEGGSTRDGRISVEAGRRVYCAARDMLLAAACSVIDPRAVFARRKPEQAMDFLQRAKFGQTEIGSFVLSIECAIPPRLQQTMLEDDNEPETPFERRVCLMLSKGLAETEVARRESAASGEIEPFLNRTRQGVSANLCEAVAEMIVASSADVVRAFFSFAPRRPLTNPSPGPISFGLDAAPVLVEAAARLRDQASYPASEIAGHVVKLESADPGRGGDAYVLDFVDTRPCSIRVSLSSEPYQVAINAHREGRVVKCVGDLSRVGRTWVLNNPRDFSSYGDVE